MERRDEEDPQGTEEAPREKSFFDDAERVDRERLRERYRTTTPAERLETAFALSDFAAELNRARRAAE